MRIVIVAIPKGNIALPSDGLTGTEQSPGRLHRPTRDLVHLRMGTER